MPEPAEKNFHADAASLRDINMCKKKFAIYKVLRYIIPVIHKNLYNWALAMGESLIKISSTKIKEKENERKTPKDVRQN